MFHIIFTVESQALKVGHAKYCILLLQLYPLMLDEPLYLVISFKISLLKMIPLKISIPNLKFQLFRNRTENLKWKIFPAAALTLIKLNKLAF